MPYWARPGDANPCWAPQGSANDRERRRATDSESKFCGVFVANFLALGLTIAFFYSSSHAAENARHTINQSAYDKTIGSNVSSTCIMGPYPYRNISDQESPATQALLPTRICTGAQVGFGTKDQQGGGGSHTASCLLPLDVTNQEGFATFIEGMAQCGQIRFLSEDLLNYGYSFNGSLQRYIYGSTTGKEDPSYLSYYFQRQNFNYLQARFFPSRFFEDQNTSATKRHWTGKRHAPLQGMAGTVELTSLQPKSVYMEVFNNGSSNFSRSALPSPEVLLSATSCLGTYILEQRPAWVPQGCKNVIGQGNAIAFLAFDTCKDYTCTNGLNNEFINDFGNWLTIGKALDTFSYGPFSPVDYEVVNNVFIALIGNSICHNSGTGMISIVNVIRFCSVWCVVDQA